MLLIHVFPKEISVKDIPDMHGECMIACDNKGAISSLSGNLMMACGFTEDQIPGLTVFDVMHRCFGDTFKEKVDLAGILKKGEYFQERFELMRAEGRRATFQMSVVPLLGEGRGHASLICSFRDITEPCAIEEILERYAQGLTVLHEVSEAFLSEAGMGDIMKGILVMIRSYYEADVVQVLVPSGNGGQEEYELLAVEGSSAVPGQKVLLREDSVEGSCVARQCPVVVTDLGSGGVVRRAEFMDDAPMGSGLGVLMHAGESVHGTLSILYKEPRQIDTAELWYLNVLSNILSVFIEKQRSFARLTESESFLHSVLEGIGEGVVVVNPQMNIVSANKGYLDIVGLEIYDVIGQSYFKVSLGEEGPSDEDDTSAVLKVFEAGRPISSLNSHMDGKGRTLSLQTKSYPIFGSSGEVVAVVETIMDITESIRLEKDLEKRVKELEEFYDMAVGRELRMIELKEEIESLRAELSRIRGE